MTNTNKNNLFEIKNAATTKVCPICGRELTLDHFHLSASNPDGHQGYCMDCACNIVKEYNEKAKSRKNETRIERANRLLAALEDALLDDMVEVERLDLFEQQKKSLEQEYAKKMKELENEKTKLKKQRNELKIQDKFRLENLTPGQRKKLLTFCSDDELLNEARKRNTQQFAFARAM